MICIGYSDHPFLQIIHFYRSFIFTDHSFQAIDITNDKTVLHYDGKPFRGHFHHIAAQYH